MTTKDHSIAWGPAVAGAGLALGAIGLLFSDAISTGHYTVSHALQPLLVLGSIKPPYSFTGRWQRGAPSLPCSC